jgi:maltose alpha-D-glucosyltransferase/alpha-amylase
LKERRTKALALRDVAGMLRSFQYAAYSALRNDEALAARWCSEVSKLYLDAYFAAAEAQVFVPSTPEQRQFFLNAFVLQKALYEVQYELNNRPAWVGIPLRGILSLIES